MNESLTKLRGEIKILATRTQYIMWINNVVIEMLSTEPVNNTLERGNAKFDKLTQFPLCKLLIVNNLETLEKGYI